MSEREEKREEEEREKERVGRCSEQRGGRSNEGGGRRERAREGRRERTSLIPLLSQHPFCATLFQRGQRLMLDKFKEGEAGEFIQEDG